MAEMIFFAKSGCSRTEQRKAVLQSSGNELCCKDILAEEWTREKLLPFVRGRDPLQIMDSSAPEILNGKIDPVVISFDDAVALMVDSPHLIKGPLVEVDGLFIQGSADQRIDKYLRHTNAEKSHDFCRKIKERRRAVQNQWQKQPLWNPFLGESFA